MSRRLPPGVRRLLRLDALTARQSDDEADDELDSVLEHRIEQLIAHGLSPAEARAEAVRRLGMTVEDARRRVHRSARVRSRHVRLRERLDGYLQDLRYAVRGLRHHPTYAATAILTLAIGLGGTTAMFSALDTLVLRPLPFERPGELMKVSQVAPARGTMPANPAMLWSYPKVRALRAEQRVFRALAAYTYGQFTLGTDDVERVSGEYVDASYFQTLGVTAWRGRTFDPRIEDVSGASPVAIVSHALFANEFGADSSIVGRAVTVDGRSYTVVGIAPPGFAGLTGDARLFLPITSRPEVELSRPQLLEYWVVARRDSNVSADAAASAVATIGTRINSAFPMPGPAWGATATSLDDARLAPAIRRAIVIVFGAMTFVLLIACVNVAGLQLARSATRRREISVRLAIGASRGRIARLLMVESLTIAVLGGVAGFCLAWIGVQGLRAVDPATTFRLTRIASLGAVSVSSIALDWRAFSFATVATLVVGACFGMIPAVGAGRVSFTAALNNGALDERRRRLSTPRAMQRMLIVAETALAIVLLTGAGLMMRSLSNLQSVDLGYDQTNVLTARLAPSPGPPAQQMPVVYDQLITRLRAIPGVVDASIGSCVAIGPCISGPLRKLDGASAEASPPIMAGVHWVTPSWFATLRVAERQGRSFNTADRLGAPPVVVVSEAAARTWWPGENPIGKRIAVGQGMVPESEVVGVVADVRQRPDSAPRPEVYVSYTQSPAGGLLGGLFLFVRRSGDAASATADVRRAIHEVVPRWPSFDVQTLAARSAGVTAPSRMIEILLVLFAATALLLAGIGIYGEMALTVSAKTREMGIRMAMGADGIALQRSVVRGAVTLVLAGSMIGVVMAAVLTKALQASLFGLSALDVPTYAGTIVVLVAAAVVASWLPARRAARINPVEALRAS